jgi:hypothetical protein
VNINHGSKIVDGSDHIPCKNPGPKHDATATFMKQKGGNNKRDAKAGKYWVGYEDNRQGRVVNN